MFPSQYSGPKTEALGSSKSKDPLLIWYVSCSLHSLMKFVMYCVTFRDFYGLLYFLLNFSYLRHKNTQRNCQYIYSKSYLEHKVLSCTGVSKSTNQLPNMSPFSKILVIFIMLIKFNICNMPQIKYTYQECKFSGLQGRCCSDDILSYYTCWLWHSGRKCCLHLQGDIIWFWQILKD